MKPEHNARFRKAVPFLLIALAIPLAFLLFTGLFGGRAEQEALLMTEQSIRRGAVQCYALEGTYPADISYLTAHYGVSIDEGRFFVDYRYIASNLMPDITVLPQT